jgi:hypothetical protein
VLEFPLPASSSCPFFLHFLPPCKIFLHLWLIFAIGSIHQEAQAVKFNCSCTSGLLRLQLSSNNFQVQLLAVLPDFSRFNCLLPTIKFNCNCTSGLLMLQLSSSIFSSSIVTVLPDYSGYNCFLRFFISSSTVVFSEFYLFINI